LNNKAKAASKKIVNVKHSKSSGGGKKSGGLNPKQVGILEALGKLHAVGITEPKRDMVQALSGNSKTTEAFKKNMGIIRSKFGYLEFPSSTTVALTDAGREYVGEPDPESLTNAYFKEHMMKPLLSKKAGEILDAISDGEVHNKIIVAQDMGYDMDKLSGYEKDLSKMSTLGFLDKTKDTIQLTDQCFPSGRPE